MLESSRIEILLTEIRDLLASREQQYKEYLASSKQVYEDQLAEAKRRAMIHRPFQWASLFIVVYAAVYCALRTVG